jgi:hypothetical protein
MQPGPFRASGTCEAVDPTITEPVYLIKGRVLAALLPPRRTQVSTRKVKSPVSRYSERLDDGRPDTSRTVTDLDITVLAPAAEEPPCPTSHETTGTLTAPHTAAGNGS